MKKLLTRSRILSEKKKLAGSGSSALVAAHLILSVGCATQAPNCAGHCVPQVLKDIFWNRKYSLGYRVTKKTRPKAPLREHEMWSFNCLPTSRQFPWFLSCAECIILWKILFKSGKVLYKGPVFCAKKNTLKSRLERQPLRRLGVKKNLAFNVWDPGL